MTAKRKILTALAFFMTAALIGLPAVAVLATADNTPQFNGYLMDITGTSTNGHFTAAYAWLSESELELFVAIAISEPGQGGWERKVNNLSYNGVELFEPGEPAEGIDYWYLTGLTINGEEREDSERWLVIRVGVQTLTEPMIIGTSMQGKGYNLVAVASGLRTVTYNGNGGAGTVADPTPFYAAGAPVTVLENAFIMAGHSFAGWNTAADGSGDPYKPGDQFAMPDHDIVLYAQWEELKLPLMITATSQTKQYGESLTFDGSEFSVAGLAEGDSIASVVLTCSGTASDATVGAYAIVPSAACGEGLDKYIITYVTGSLEVTPAALTITADDCSKVYDGIAFSGGGSVTYAGFVAGEDESVLAGELTFSGDSQGATAVGSYTIVPGGLSAENYTISFAAGTLAITPAKLIITADNQTKLYGETFAFAGDEFSVQGLAGDDCVTSVTLACDGIAANANAGTYAIVPGAAAGEGLANYHINYRSGELAVAEAALTVTANDENKVYDGIAFSGGSVTYAGFVVGEDESVLTGELTFGGDSQGATAVGSYTITPGGLSAGNYAITYVAGSLEVTPAALTVTADDCSKVYDGIAFSGGSVTYAGFVAGEDESVLAGELTFGGDSQGATAVGSYTITPGGLSAENYDITFVDGSLVITEKGLPLTRGRRNPLLIGGLVALALGGIVLALARKHKLITR